MDKIRSWPRWIRFGLISAFVSLTLTIPFLIEGSLWSFLIEVYLWPFIGPIGPSIILMILGGPDMGAPVFFIVESALFWFLIGGFLGRYIQRATIAGLLWLGILMLMSMVGVYFSILVAVGA